MILLLLACAGGVKPADPAPPPPAVLPQDDAPFAPSLLQAQGDPAALVDPGCEACHAEVAEEWQASAHAHASFDNPWYRVSVRSFREGSSKVDSRFCGGCHDPALLLTGAMDEEVDPRSPATSAGVGCLMCHGATEANVNGNASLKLDLTHVSPASDAPEDIEVHRGLMSQVLDQQALCVSCHRGFLSPASGSPMFLFGMDEGGAHGASVYAGSRAEVLDAQPAAQCRDCHVSPDGVVSHRFAGGQTALAAGKGDAAQLEAMRVLLRDAALIDLPVVWGPDGAVDPAELALAGGEELSLDVIVRNEAVGHRFPGGLRDTQDTWIALELVDAQGQTLAWAGQGYAEGEDPSAWRLRVGVLDGDGHPELLHQPQEFRAAGWDASVPPRDSRAVRYTWTAPEDLAPEQLPIHVSLTLKHRRHVSELHVSACEEQKDRPAFDVSGIDACAPQPITDIASASVTLGGEAVSGGADRPRWERSRDHAMALRHHVQERLSEAEPSIAELRATAPDDEVRALSWWLEATLAAHQGRLDDALAAADQAEALIGPHPALDRARGDAYAQVWRWAEAADAYAKVASAAPNDTSSWQDLAQAAGSAGQDERALKAAQRGLQNQPRDESLLRSQDLALRAMGAADPEAEAAWVYVRRPDDTSALRTACAQEVEGCDQWLRPLPTIALVVE